MFDVTGPVSPSEPTPPKKSKKTHKAKEATQFDKQPKKDNRTEKLLGMKVTPEQKQQFYAQMCNTIVQQIKHDAAKQKKAMKRLRESELGQPPSP